MLQCTCSCEFQSFCFEVDHAFRTYPSWLVRIQTCGKSNAMNQYKPSRSPIIWGLSWGYEYSIWIRQPNAGWFTIGFTKIYQRIYIHVPLWLFSIAMENGPLTDDFPVQCSVYNGFSIAISNNQRVHQDYRWSTSDFLGFLVDSYFSGLEVPAGNLDGNATFPITSTGI